MKNIALIYMFLFLVISLQSQEIVEPIEGAVSYVTSQNIYVKFNSTKNISVGDTLMTVQDGKLQPALVVSNLSSISCVCIPILGVSLKVNDIIQTSAKQKTIDKPVLKNDEVPSAIAIAPTIIEVKSTESEKKTNKQKIDGRLSIASYSNFSNTDGGSSQRMRYTFSMNAKNIGESKFSVESYLSFVHTNKNWSEIKDNIFNGLKIYNLALVYQPVESVNIWLGRKINPKLSNIGAIDGLQVEKSFKSISVGAIVGSRPSYMDYSYDFSLFQFGAYLGHNYNGKNGNMQTTIAFVDQENNWKTDRRFAYFQYYNSLVKNFYFLGSAELELYQKVNGVESSNVNLSNLYLMLRYRPVRQLSFSLSYRSQSSMIYYETYDSSVVQQLTDDKNIQGMRGQVVYRPIKYLSVGVKAGYRDRKDDPKPSKNFYGYLSYSRVPGLDVSATLSVTMLESSYLSGNVYSINLSRDLIPGKLYGGVSYRYVDYKFINYESTLIQHVGDVNLTWRIMKKLSLSMAYEGIFESVNQYNRLYLNLIKRL
ncbi:MAG: hypothetical protein HQ521_18210 [Bacteroidetes bacterium]|nr:hypothetical protein [Bacteroidota bacterium]